MGSISCIKHPQYDGKSSPILSCKTCCALFIHNIKITREEEKKTEDDASKPPVPTTLNELAKAKST